MSHPNATLTPKGHTLLARCIVEDGWSLHRAAERFQVSTGTANRWATRYREHGKAGMHNRSSQPHTSPHRTCTRTERRIIALCCRGDWEPNRQVARPLRSWQEEGSCQESQWLLPQVQRSQSPRRGAADFLADDHGFFRGLVVG